MVKIKKLIFFLSVTVALIAGFLALGLQRAAVKLQAEYAKRESAAVSGRDLKPMFYRPNYLGYYGIYSKDIPGEFNKFLIAKEDKFFYWHLGINPVSIIKNLGRMAGIGQRRGSSTITQQLAKILAGQENRRTFGNKISELWKTAALEITAGKDQILKRYADSIYFGNRLQGAQTASRAYFAADADKLTKAQIFQLLASISSPTEGNPLQTANIEQAKLLAKNMAVDIEDEFTRPEIAKKNLASFFADNTALFELEKHLASDQCPGNQQTTLDSNLNEKLRILIADNLTQLSTKKAKNAAALIVSLPDNKILALSGSPDPTLDIEGYKINMLNEPRQIGSTIKPFIYLKAFEKGMRPYTLINDREYKYPAGEGFSIYPENYDRAYHGLMTAHYALANSINVAAAKTLEFVGVDDFGKFIEEDMGMETQQDYSSYQMGIAMGAMETDIVNLAQAFTIFPNEGRLKNLTLFENSRCNNLFSQPMDATPAKKIYIELVNKILADRAIAQDQFTSASRLNLPAANYALKTGTSHDYTDSWVIGYTPDFLVAVWVGNADASAMEGVSGQIGAGRIWGDIMQMMLASDYNKKTPFDFSDIVEYKNGNNIEYGLEKDDYESAKNILETTDTALILKPHNNDIYQFENNTRIVLTAKKPVSWIINGREYGNAAELIFSPPEAGNYEITASDGGKKENILIEFTIKR
jgi:membrane carboxypeptidase/penicillin-binding protein PbpC